MLNSISLLKWVHEKYPDKITEKLKDYLRNEIGIDEVDYLNVFSVDLKREVWLNFNTKKRINDLSFQEIILLLEKRKIPISVEELYPDFLNENLITEYLKENTV